MKTFGLIGGMSWNSSSEYYTILNEIILKRLGGSHSAKCIMYSGDFEEIIQLKHEDNWEKIKNELIRVAQTLKNAGADFIVICTNTMHRFVPDIEKRVGF